MPASPGAGIAAGGARRRPASGWRRRREDRRVADSSPHSAAARGPERTVARAPFRRCPPTTASAAAQTLRRSVRTSCETRPSTRSADFDPSFGDFPMTARRPFLAGLCAFVPAVLLLAQPAAAQTALDTIMARKTIRVAVPTDSPPYGFVGTDLAPKGLDVDMAN